MSREQILEQALKHELRALAPSEVEGTTSPVTDACLDAETLAAWFDGALDVSQAAMAEAHVSSCTRCQSLVGTFARGTLGTQSTPGTVGTAGTLGTWFRWRLWVPLVAGAAAVTLWMVVPQQREVATTPPQAKVEADAPASPAAAESTSPQRAVESPALADKTGAREEFSARAREDRQQPREEKKEVAAQLRESAPASLKPPTSAEATVGKQASSRENAPVSAARDAAAAAETAAAPPPASAAPAVAGLERNARLTFAPLQIVSPAALQRWRAVPAGIEHSEDGGATWILVRQTSGEAVIAGSSPAPQVCWLVGQAGVVLITSDGKNFVRADVPDRDNLVAVTATDARTATVSTAGGRTLRTDDGGRSWR